MRLDPVYVLAPEPRGEAREPSRRVVLAAMLGTTASAFGFGWLIGGRRADASTDDRALAWALELVSGPDDRLLRHYRRYLMVVWEHAGRHAELWDGVRRLTRLVVEARGPTDDERRLLALSLLQTLETEAHPPDLDHEVARLRERSR